MHHACRMTETPLQRCTQWLLVAVGMWPFTACASRSETPHQNRPIAAVAPLAFSEPEPSLENVQASAWMNVRVTATNTTDRPVSISRLIWRSGTLPALPIRVLAPGESGDFTFDFRTPPKPSRFSVKATFFFDGGGFQILTMTGAVGDPT